jgi:hypothetical protein
MEFLGQMMVLAEHLERFEEPTCRCVPEESILVE